MFYVSSTLSCVASIKSVRYHPCSNSSHRCHMTQNQTGLKCPPLCPRTNGSCLELYYKLEWWVSLIWRKHPTRCNLRFEERFVGAQTRLFRGRDAICSRMALVLNCFVLYLASCTLLQSWKYPTRYLRHAVRLAQFPPKGSYILALMWILFRLLAYLLTCSLTDFQCCYCVITKVINSPKVRNFQNINPIVILHVYLQFRPICLSWPYVYGVWRSLRMDKIILVGCMWTNYISKCPHGWLFKLKSNVPVRLVQAWPPKQCIHCTQECDGCWKSIHELYSSCCLQIQT